MSQRDIINCGQNPKVNFHFECPMTWDELEETGESNQRWCKECEKRVFWCHNNVEAGLRAEQNECIAVPAWLAEGVRNEEYGVIVVGMPNYRRMFEEVTERYQAKKAK
ncbi:MAG: hypothetical protein EP343_12295 [Deltaproteobacteria bacterium]|nr:MAG: hypothetical protein EP343_12295 [Deltaproteobacteria bacterium]